MIASILVFISFMNVVAFPNIDVTTFDTSINTYHNTTYIYVKRSSSSSNETIEFAMSMLPNLLDTHNFHYDFDVRYTNTTDSVSFACNSYIYIKYLDMSFDDMKKISHTVNNLFHMFNDNETMSDNMYIGLYEYTAYLHKVKIANVFCHVSSTFDTVPIFENVKLVLSFYQMFY